MDPNNPAAQASYGAPQMAGQQAYYVQNTAQSVAQGQQGYPPAPLSYPQAAPGYQQQVMQAPQTFAPMMAPGVVPGMAMLGINLVSFP